MPNNLKITPELMEKLGNVQSFEELKALAKEAGIEISDEELKQYFDEETMAMKLGSEDLEKVAGGKGGLTGCPGACYDEQDCSPHIFVI